MDLLLASTIPFAQETLSSSLNVLLVNLFMWLLSLNCVLFKVKSRKVYLFLACAEKGHEA